MTRNKENNNSGLNLKKNRQYRNFTNFRCGFIFGIFLWSLVLPKLKRYLNEKNASSDRGSVHGHRNLNKTECSVIARHRNFNVPKIL